MRDMKGHELAEINVGNAIAVGQHESLRADVGFDSRQSTSASYERSDICVVPAAGVIGEAMVALTIARLAQEKFGGDSALELRRNFDGYIQQIRNY